MELLTWMLIVLCISQYAMFSGLNLAFFSVSKLRLELEAAAGPEIEAYPYRGGPATLISWIPPLALWLSTSLLATIVISLAELIKLRQ